MKEGWTVYPYLLEWMEDPPPLQDSYLSKNHKSTISNKRTPLSH